MVTLPSWLAATRIRLDKHPANGLPFESELVFLATDAGFAGQWRSSQGQPAALLGLSSSRHPEGGVALAFVWRTADAGGMGLAHVVQADGSVFCEVVFAGEGPPGERQLGVARSAA